MPTRGQRARNLANGRCADCPQDRAPDSTRWCAKHREKNRAYQEKFRAQIPRRRQILDAV